MKNCCMYDKNEWLNVDRRVKIEMTMVLVMVALVESSHTPSLIYMYAFVCIYVCVGIVDSQTKLYATWETQRNADHNVHHVCMPYIHIYTYMYLLLDCGLYALLWHVLQWC